MTRSVRKTTTAPAMTVELVNPETAQTWLGRNACIRNLRRGIVNSYARDMEAGLWAFTGEPIKFDLTGALIDGQHRLHALVKSDVTLSLAVFRNIDPSAVHVMDSGARRTAGDALKFQGYKTPTLLASAAGMVLTEGGSKRRGLTHSEILAAVEADPSIPYIVDEVLPKLRMSQLTTGSVAFYAYWRLHQVDDQAAVAFFDALSSLAGQEPGSAILALHRRLYRAEHSVGRGSWLYRQECLALIFDAWNAWRRGEKRVRLSVIVGAYGRIQVPDPI